MGNNQHHCDIVTLKKKTSLLISGFEISQMSVSYGRRYKMFWKHYRQTPVTSAKHFSQVRLPQAKVIDGRVFLISLGFNCKLVKLNLKEIQVCYSIVRSYLLLVNHQQIRK